MRFSQGFLRNAGLVDSVRRMARVGLGLSLGCLGAACGPHGNAGGRADGPSDNRGAVVVRAPGVSTRHDDDGFKLRAPLGIAVDVGPDGVSVKAPGVHVRTADAGVRVRAPGVRVESGAEGTRVDALGVKVRAGSGR